MYGAWVICCKLCTFSHSTCSVASSAGLSSVWLSSARWVWSSGNVPALSHTSSAISSHAFSPVMPIHLICVTHSSCQLQRREASSILTPALSTHTHPRTHTHTHRKSGVGGDNHFLWTHRERAVKSGSRIGKHVVCALWSCLYFLFPSEAGGLSHCDLQYFVSC